jgi:hypothetical protein
MASWPHFARLRVPVWHNPHRRASAGAGCLGEDCRETGRKNGDWLRVFEVPVPIFSALCRREIAGRVQVAFPLLSAILTFSDVNEAQLERSIHERPRHLPTTTWPSSPGRAGRRSPAPGVPVMVGAGVGMAAAPTGERKPPAGRRKVGRGAGRRAKGKPALS